MGCGNSTLEPEEASPSRRLNRHNRQRTIVPPINNKDSDDDDGAMVVMNPLRDDKEEAKTAKGVGLNEKLKEKCVMNKKEEEENVVLNSGGGKEEHVGDHDIHEGKNVKNNEEEQEEDSDRDDSYIGPGSPSFRDYCIDYDSTNRSSMADSNDYCDSGDSTMNCSGHDSMNRKTMPKNEPSVNANKESEKKERRGRGFRNVINGGKGRGGRRNLLNFSCYNSSSESNAEGSMNKVVGKTV
ncbi:hypothetical protein TanjilG_24331 [Lupinus angustifolius]|uniref:Uncharacterized protein n=1 Tax=Lupinus angustifolius TaxID=3871 RepID=A0A394DCK4_LUPAN|nr:PREDICTED: uncharacterized protein LOC109338934 [Lupinus angustifolius]OIW20843.1 hypothetical protein TanjilG_24331 [Lupinus angustifolius]